MKIRNGFVSNSSSSSFVVLREALTDRQEDMIIGYQDWINFFIKKDHKLINKFEYYESDPWSIKVYDDLIFGETSMDNFSFYSYLKHIDVDSKYIKWDDGYNDEPYQEQLKFIKEAKLKIRKEKLEKINNKKQ